MIDYVKGQLTYIDSQSIVVEAGGIGYQMYCGNPFQYQHLEHQEMLIYTYQHVREDILALYGFSTREERRLFERMLQVSGIGPKGALAILAAGTPGQVIAAIQEEDLSYLTKFPGIGKKTAQRLILDLKDKLDDVAMYFSKEVSLSEGASTVSSSSSKGNKVGVNDIKETIEALMALGYSEREIERITPELKKKAEQDWGTDQYIKLGLQLLMK